MLRNKHYLHFPLRPSYDEDNDDDDDHNGMIRISGEVLLWADSNCTLTHREKERQQAKEAAFDLSTTFCVMRFILSNKKKDQTQRLGSLQNWIAQ